MNLVLRLRRAAFDMDQASAQIVGSILLKVLLGLALAGVIGWERELHRRPAGMRTHMLMMLGVVLFAEASKAFSTSTPDRIAAQILTGVGFLGAGTIMRMGPEVRGLTSAASIWATAAIGVVISLGGAYMLIAVISTLLALFVLAVVDNFERKYKEAAKQRMMRVNLQKQTNLLPLLRALADANISVESIKILESEAGVQLEMQTVGDPLKAMEVVANAEGVNSASWAV